MIYVFSELDLVTPDIYRAWLGKSTDERRKRALSYRFYNDRLLCVSVYMLACFALKLERAEFVYGEYGKPELAEGEQCFNLTHCDGLAACVTSTKPAGIDAERVKPYPPGILERVFTEREIRQVVFSQHPDQMFFKLWTLKESYVKALGQGLGFPLHEVEFTISDGGIACSDKRFTFTSHTHGEHIVSACGAEAHMLTVVGLNELCDMHYKT